jgi:hypothetical protein
LWEGITKGAATCTAAFTGRRISSRSERRYGYIDCHGPETLENLIEDAAGYLLER